MKCHIWVLAVAFLGHNIFTTSAREKLKRDRSRTAPAPRFRLASLIFVLLATQGVSSLVESVIEGRLQGSSERTNRLEPMAATRGLAGGDDRISEENSNYTTLPFFTQIVDR
jgi:hypothetical protein